MNYRVLFKGLRENSGRIVERAKMTEHTFMVLVALIIGTIAGFASIVIRILIRGITFIFYANNGNITGNILSAPWFIKLFIITVLILFLYPVITFINKKFLSGNSLIRLKPFFNITVALLIITASSIFLIISSTDSFTNWDGNVLKAVSSSPWFIKIIGPALGGLFVGPVIFYFAREAKGHGVPEVMQSIILKGGSIRPQVAFIKAVASIITIGTGGSVGREGPIIQIGSSVGSTVGQFLKVSNLRLRTFVGCGAAAGIAAAFNAPIAGALFAVEILLHDFAFLNLSPIVVSSVMATVISHHFEGNFAAFIVPQYQLKSPFELLLYFFLAILSAIAGVIFIKILYFSEDFFDKKFKFPEQLKPLIGGIAMGCVAIFFPQIMGIGYESITDALHGHTIWQTALVLIFVKILATSITLGSGGSGGIFAPSLFLGAMTGACFGGIMNFLFPGMVASPGAYALVAMGGLVAATTHAPITAIIIVFELTNDYNIILPLMITCIVSTIISSSLSRESIYTLKLLNRNIVIKNGAEINIMKSIFVKDIYTTEVHSIQRDTRFDEVVNSVLSGTDPYFPVIDRKGKLEGIISMHDIKEHLYDRDILSNLLIADDIAKHDIITSTPDDDCQSVLDKLSSHNLEGLPVLDRTKPKKLLGMIWRKDILDAYNKEIERRDIASSFASRITMKNIDSSVHFMEGCSMTEVPIPKIFVGKSIKELNIRAVYGVDILLIRKNTEEGSKIKAIPNPDYVFSYNESIVIAGEIGKINLVKSL